jgi:5'-nucleotidase
MARKRTVTPQDNEQVRGRLHLSSLGKASAALISVVGTITATLFLLVDHGVFSSGNDQKREPVKVLNVAVRELRAPLLGGSDLAGESQLGNLVADAYRKIAGTQLAFVNSQGIRANIEAGEVTRGDLAAVVPFNNRLVKMELTGTQVWALLAQQFENNQILQVSGLRFMYRITHQGKAVIRAIEELSLGSSPKPVPRGASKRYTVVVDSFLANGGDGFSALTGATKRVATAIGDVQALAQYIGALARPFDSGIQGRIIRLQ